MASYNKSKRRPTEFLETELESARDELLSQILGSGKGEKKAAKKESGKAGIQESIVFQLFGSSQNESSAKLKHNKAEKSSEARAQREPGMFYHEGFRSEITRSRERLSSQENQAIKEQVRKIMEEIKKLALSTKKLESEFGDITVQTAPAKPGKYYVSFFDWLLIMVRQSRQKVEDSKAWLDTVKGKSKKKMGYWDKSKKYGTSFSQANERNVATSTG